MLKHLAAISLTMVVTCGAASAAELGRIELKEQLGLTFAPQVIHVKLEASRGALRDVARCTLRDPAGDPQLAQFKALDRWPDGSVHNLRVSFVVSLAAGSNATYLVDDSGKAPADDGQLKLKRDAHRVELASPLCAVEIPALSGTFTAAAPAPGEPPPPVARIRGRSAWYGQGRLLLDSGFFLRERQVEVSDDGPVCKRVMVTYAFTKGAPSSTFAGDACLYAVEITLCRGEQLVRLKESFSFPFSDLSQNEFAFDFYPGLKPDTTVNRPLAASSGPAYDVGSFWDLYAYDGPMAALKYDRDDTLGFLTPHAVSPSNYVHFACYDDKAGADADLVGIINTAPDRWDHIAYMSPGDAWKLVQSPHTFFSLKKVKDVRLSLGKDKSLVAHFPLSFGTREWAFFAGGPFPRTRDYEVTNAGKAEKKTSQSAPRDWFKERVRHYQLNALDRIKDWVLEWPADPTLAYPHLYYDTKEFAERGAKYAAWSGGPAIPPLTDAAAAAKLKEVVLKIASDTIKTMTENPGPPHHITQSTYSAANLADLLLGSGALTPAETRQLKAQLAYMAYIMNWRAYWAPELGYGANPNMTSFAYDAVGLLGMLLADHPESRNWIRSCTTELDREAANWISPEGAWIESLHYTRAAWQEHSMTMTALKHMGLRDYFRDPQVQRFFGFYFTAQTPPDPEATFQRGVACIGNSYDIEAVQEFNLWAHGLADVNPALAAAMQWMWREEGFGTVAEMKGKVFKGYGAGYEMWFGSHLGLPPYYAAALFDPFVQPAPPATPALLRGGAFSGFGAILNAHFGGRKETKLYLREGSYYSHWDADQGGLVLWGKGAPLVMDHGYGEFHPWFHSRLNVNHMYDDDLGDITDCFAGDDASFVQGEITLSRLSLREHPWVKEWPMQPEPLNGRSMRTDWTRRIVFEKDADPDGPNYLVMRDSVNGELPTEWVLWAYGTIDDFQATPIRAKGKFGVDLLVYLLDPDKGKVNTGRIEISHPIMRRHQTLIQLQRPAGRGVLAVLFPSLPAAEPPQVSALADGAAVKVVAGPRTDVVFLPEKPGAASAEGVEFRGTAASLSKRGDGTHYWLAARSSLKAPELAAACNTAIEFTVGKDAVRGHCNSPDVQPRLELAGTLAARAAELNANGRATPLKPDGDKLTVELPAGETTFTLKLR